MKHGICFASLLWFTGCATQAAVNVKLVAFEANAATGKSLGVLKGEDCGIKVLGYGANPRLDEAFFDFHKKSGARYANNVSARYEYNYYFFWEKRCYYVKGNGFK